jgi:hypothetical protein
MHRSTQTLTRSLPRPIAPKHQNFSLQIRIQFMHT